MLIPKKAGVFILILSFIAAFSLSATGEVYFEDDFEADDIGDEPSLWNMIGGFTLEVVEDPQNPNNKVLAETGEADGLGVPTPIGWEKQDFWTDYVWEFDWMWEMDVYVGTAHRYQDAQHYYHSSRRLGGQISSYITGTATGMSLITSPGVPKLILGIGCRSPTLGTNTL